MATILSAQSTDARVNIVTPALFKRYPDARALAKATTRAARAADSFDRLLPREVEGAHRHGAGARRTSTAARCPATWTRSSTLPGVGRKTANVVLGHALGVPGLPVDRHVLRVVEPHRHRRRRRSGRRRAAAVRGAAAGALDARVGHADSSRPPDLQAEAALRPVRRCATTATTTALVVARRRARTARRAKRKPAVRKPKRLATRGSKQRSKSSSLRRWRSIPRRFRRRDAEHRDRRRRRAVARAARARWRSSRRTRCSASIRARRSPSARGATATRCPIAS